MEKLQFDRNKFCKTAEKTPDPDAEPLSFLPGSSREVCLQSAEAFLLWERRHGKLHAGSTSRPEVPLQKTKTHNNNNEQDPGPTAATQDRFRKKLRRKTWNSEKLFFWVLLLVNMWLYNLTILYFFPHGFSRLISENIWVFSCKFTSQILVFSPQWLWRHPVKHNNR